MEPVDYFIKVKEEAQKEIMGAYSEFAVEFVREISKDQYLKLV